VREAWMSALQFELPERRVLDLYAGSGALGLEALSRGAAHASFVESAPRALAVLRANIEKLGATALSEVVRQDAIAYVAGLDIEAFDIALADPPYGQGFAGRLMEQFGARPFARVLWVEHGAKESLPQLPGARTRRYGDTAITSIPANP
jgi:16S rRNA (guanine966-N2)-methyltransferase